MFYYIDGTVTVLEEGVAVIDAGGVGYLLNVTLNTLSRLRTGERARLYTYLIVREDAFDIYGFYDRAEKRSFEMLLGVSGVGPKAAQSILSGLTPEGFAMAIMTENEKALTAAPGIGKRIAQRVILELKDKMAKENIGMPAGSGTVQAPQTPAAGKKTKDVIAALEFLGYSGQEIQAGLAGVDFDTMTADEIVKYVVKNSLKQ